MILSLIQFFFDGLFLHRYNLSRSTYNVLNNLWIASIPRRSTFLIVKISVIKRINLSVVINAAPHVLRGHRNSNNVGRKSFRRKSIPSTPKMETNKRERGLFRPELCFSDVSSIIYLLFMPELFSSFLRSLLHLRTDWPISSPVRKIVACHKRNYHNNCITL
jgi:hypothetical protein